MKKLLSLLTAVVFAVTLLVSPTLAAVGNNIDNDFESGWIPGWFQGGEGHGYSIVTDNLNSANHELRSNSTSAYNAAYFGEYADNIVFEFDYKNNFAGGESWGGASLRVGSSRYDVGLMSSTFYAPSCVRIWRAGAEVAYNSMPGVGKGNPNMPVLVWNNIKIAMQGGRIRIFVNNMLVIDYTDASPYTTGGFGFRAANADVSYDNLKFYPVSELNVGLGININNDFESGWIAGWLAGSEGHGYSIVPDNLDAANHELKSNSTSAYNAAYFGEYIDNAVMEFDYKNNYAGGESWGGASLRCGPSGRYDVALMSSTFYAPSCVRIYRAGVEVAYNSAPTIGMGNPNMPVQLWSNIKIVMQGGRIRVYVNNLLTIDYTDASPFTEGAFGLRADHADVSYDNLKFYSSNLLNVTSVTFGSLAVSDSNIITNVTPATLLSAFKTSFTPATGYSLAYLKNSVPLIDTNTVGTGTKVTLSRGAILLKTYGVVVYGDVTGNGTVTVDDLAAVKNHILTQQLLAEESLIAADVTKNSSVTVSDLLAVKKFLVGLGTISQS